MPGTNEQMVVLKKAIRVDMSVVKRLQRFFQFGKVLRRIRLNQHGGMTLA